MKSIENNHPVNNPAPAPSDREELQPKQALNKLQFEEAVQRLREEQDSHPKPARGTFY
jgi:hypothetical protein